ncbi:MAG TPA: YdcF family protein [Candidatus Saccharimonadales bacterium]|nr:YdcF family protein [Candidatus Saccharimonadales bacterium]
MDEASIKASANIVWNYTKMGAKLEPADAIIAMGSMDMRVAERAADLWQQKLAPIIVVTGGLGRLTGDDVTLSEAAKFAAVLRACGIPDEAVLIEDKASNGAETLRFPLLCFAGTAIQPPRSLP